MVKPCDFGDLEVSTAAAAETTEALIDLLPDARFCIRPAPIMQRQLRSLDMLVSAFDAAAK